MVFIILGPRCWSTPLGHVLEAEHYEVLLICSKFYQLNITFVLAGSSVVLNSLTNRKSEFPGKKIQEWQSEARFPGQDIKRWIRNPTALLAHFFPWFNCITADVNVLPFLTEKQRVPTSHFRGTVNAAQFAVEVGCRRRWRGSIFLLWAECAIENDCKSELNEISLVVSDLWLLYVPFNVISSDQIKTLAFLTFNTERRYTENEMNKIKSKSYNLIQHVCPASLM